MPPPNANPSKRNTVGDRSRASSSTSEDASIYFRVVIGRKHHWFVIKGDSSTPEGEILYPYLTPEPKFLEFPAVAAVGSTIYLLGGSDIDYCKRFPYIHFPPSMYDVYYIDTLRPKDGWKRSPYSMNQPRSRTHAVTVDGKIYVFGGSETFPTSVSPEVFDTRFEDQGWRDLQDDPSVPGWIYGHAVFNKRIFMFSLPIKELYYYDVEADSWGLYSENFGLYRRTSAFVDGILYFVDESAIFGFDISKPDSLPKIVRGLEEDEDCYYCKWMPQPDSYGNVPDAHLLSLGNGKLAVLSAVSVYHGSEKVLRVSCSKIKMAKEENTAGEVDFVAHPLSLSYYYVKGFIFIDCVAVFPSPKMEAQDVNKDDNATATDDKNNTSSSSNNNKKDSKKNKKNKKKTKNKKNKKKN